MGLESVVAGPAGSAGGYSGEPDAGGGGGTRIIPEHVVYATDPGVTEDLAPASLSDFGSGATFNGDYALDPVYNPAFAVTSGQGYLPGVHVGFVAFLGYSAGFATAYETIDFKVKWLAANSIEVKFFGPENVETSRVYNVTTDAGATSLGNGWYQVSVPLTDFAATLGTNAGFLLGPQGNQGAPFTFLLTDIGFSGTAGGGTSCDPVGNELAAANGDFELGNLDCWTTFNNGGTIHEVQVARGRGTALLRSRVEKLENTLPVLLTGDFNCATNNQAYKTLVADDFFTDTWLIARERRGEGLATFNGFKEIPKTNIRIDWILARGEVEVSATEIVTFNKDGKFPSDHFPLVSWLRFAE